MGTKKFQSSSAISKGLGNALDTIANIGSLPPIQGTWFFVDTGDGSDDADGRSIASPLATLEAAYDKCTSGAGDGIAYFCPADASSSNSLSMTHTLTWAKWGITVYGMSKGCGYMSRNRITTSTITTTATLTVPTGGLSITRASGSFITDGWVVGMQGICAGGHTDTFTVSAVAALTLTLDSAITVAAGTITSITSYIPTMIDMTGSNNCFMNMYIANEGTQALSLVAVTVHANRNKFENCHFRAAFTTNTLSVATGAPVTVDTASETEFKHCWFGDNNAVRTAAQGNVLLTGVQGQNFFEDCYFLQDSATSDCCAIRVAAADTIGGQIFLKRCSIMNWRVSKGAILSTSAIYIVGAASDNKGILIDSCAMYGYTSWCNVSGVAFIANSDATASGAGGIATAS